MEVDRGFRTWFARLVITYLRKEEASIVEERRARIRREWSWFFAIQHVWGFGWSMVRIFLWALWIGLALTGFMLALLIFCGTVVLIAVFACPILPPDVCPRIEIQDARTGRVLVSEKNAALIIQVAEALRVSTSEGWVIIYNVPKGEVWSAFGARVCKRFEDAGFYEVIAEGGVFRI